VAASGQLKAAVAAAVEGVRIQFGSDNVTVVGDGQGGAWVEIDNLDLGGSYEQDTTFLVCLLPFNLPNADVYPMFVRPDLTRLDGQHLGDGFQATTLRWVGRPPQRSVVQVSRRTRRENFAAQTPAQKIEKVLKWIRTQ
jgi:hypothetical protein